MNNGGVLEDQDIGSIVSPLISFRVRIDNLCTDGCSLSEDGTFILLYACLFSINCSLMSMSVASSSSPKPSCHI